ncbi:hypothetical protein E8E11_005856 [Didymella keratinophila]|nr:hypothetical protein E8E11_005856 [Didymella keratinophila]
MTPDRPTRVQLACSSRSSKRVRLGLSKINDKGQWYELWYTWRSYTGLRSDGDVTEKTHEYSQAEGGVKVNQTLFPLDESTLPVELKDNPCGTWKAFGRELWLKRFGPNMLIVLPNLIILAQSVLLPLSFPLDCADPCDETLYARC